MDEQRLQGIERRRARAVEGDGAVNLGAALGLADVDVPDLVAAVREQGAVIANWEALAEGYLERAQAAEAEVERLQSSLKDAMDLGAHLWEAVQQNVTPEVLQAIRSDWDKAERVVDLPPGHFYWDEIFPAEAAKNSAG